MPEALLAAVEDGKVEEVDRLIAADADIKFANKKGLEREGFTQLDLGAKI